MQGPPSAVPRPLHGAQWHFHEGVSLVPKLRLGTHLPGETVFRAGGVSVGGRAPAPPRRHPRHGKCNFPPHRITKRSVVTRGGTRLAARREPPPLPRSTASPARPALRSPQLRNEGKIALKSRTFRLSLADKSAAYRVCPALHSLPPPHYFYAEGRISPSSTWRACRVFHTPLLMRNLPKNAIRTTLFLLLSMSTHIHAATITGIPSEFASPVIETWESFAAGFLASNTPILNGTATASGANMIAYTPGATSTWHFGLGPFPAQVHDGNRGLGMSSSAASLTIAFNTPITSIGGFWGIASTTSPVTLTFYDSLHSALGQTQFSYGRPNNDGTLEWHGWSISTPANSVTLTGQFFVNDSLRVDTAPEPSCALLILCGILGIANSRSLRFKEPLVISAT